MELSWLRNTAAVYNRPCLYRWQIVVHRHGGQCKQSTARGSARVFKRICQREHVIQQTMKVYKPKAGIVAILDALGAATYDDREIHEFLQSRSVIMRLLNDKAEHLAHTLDVSQIKTYTFNDTMLI